MPPAMGGTANRFGRRLRALLLATGIALPQGPVAARAAELDASENARLERGETIVHPGVQEQKSGRYVGGVTYALLDASPGQLDALFEDVSAYRQILPYTKDVRSLGHDGPDLVIWLRQGKSFLDASYTVRVRSEPGEATGERLVRFWIDRRQRHGIDDAYGYFRYRPVASDGPQRVLLTFGIWVDIGPGLVRDLFEGRIQRVVLTVPDHVRATLAARGRGRV